MDKLKKINDFLDQLPFGDFIKNYIILTNYKPTIALASIWGILSIVVVPAYKKIAYINNKAQLSSLETEFEKLNLIQNVKLNSFDLVKVQRYLEDIFFSHGLMMFILATMLPVLLAFCITVSLRRGWYTNLWRLLGVFAIFLGRLVLISFILPNLLLNLGVLKSVHPFFSWVITGLVIILTTHFIFFIFDKVVLNKFRSFKLMTCILVVSTIVLSSHFYNKLSVDTNYSRIRALKLTHQKFPKLKYLDDISNFLIKNDCLLTSSPMLVSFMKSECASKSKDKDCLLKYKKILQEEGGSLNKCLVVQKDYWKEISYPIEPYIRAIIWK